MLAAAVLIAMCLAASAVLTRLVRDYAVARDILDHPNTRSSHSRPTPRGGGLAIAIAALGTIFLVALGPYVPGRLALALCGGGAVVALAGWTDDRIGLSARLRALVHTLAAAWAVVVVGGMPSLQLGATELSLGLGGIVLAVLGVVWLTNLYNFMDGIDGIAGVEAVSVGAVGGLLAWFVGSPSIALCAALVAAAAGGFLVWNWPPAKIFMGDVGSGLLGFVFAVLAVSSEVSGGPPVVIWLILLGVFVFDATVTLIRRVLRGEQWYSAHRSHAYQRAVQAGWSHRRVTLVVLTLNVVLGVLAGLALVQPVLLSGIAATALAILTLPYLAIERVRPMWDRPRTLPRNAS